MNWRALLKAFGRLVDPSKPIDGSVEPSGAGQRRGAHGALLQPQRPWVHFQQAGPVRRSASPTIGRRRSCASRTLPPIHATPRTVQALEPTYSRIAPVLLNLGRRREALDHINRALKMGGLATLQGLDCANELVALQRGGYVERALLLAGRRRGTHLQADHCAHAV